MKEVLVPIFVCVVLPVAIVLIVSLAKMNADNKRSQIILKALEANKDVDTDKLLESMRKPQKSAREILTGRLLRGCILSLVGVALVVIGAINYSTFMNFDIDSVFFPISSGGVSIAVGLAYLIVYFITRKQVDNPESESK